MSISWNKTGNRIIISSMLGSPQKALHNWFYSHAFSSVMLTNMVIYISFRFFIGSSSKMKRKKVSRNTCGNGKNEARCMKNRKIQNGLLLYSYMIFLWAELIVDTFTCIPEESNVCLSTNRIVPIFPCTAQTNAWTWTSNTHKKENMYLWMQYVNQGFDLLFIFYSLSLNCVWMYSDEKNVSH